ncbi:primosomal protein N', partial [Streptococcus suis]
TEKWYRVCLEKLREADISNRAKNRQQLREFLLEHSEDQLLSNLKSASSADTLRYFQEKGYIEVWEEDVSRTQGVFDKVEQTQALDLN